MTDVIAGFSDAPSDAGRHCVPCILTAVSEYERRYGKATLLTNYELEAIMAALTKAGDYDPDLLAKLYALRHSRD